MNAERRPGGHATPIIERVLISGCLVGMRVRYHGGDALVEHVVIDQWAMDGRLIPLCPEVAAGLLVPRPPAEIASGGGGLAVLEGRAAVHNATAEDVSAAYRAAASHAVSLARKTGARVAVLKDGSPSCGTSFTYDGSFAGGRVAESGVTSAALTAMGVKCFNPSQLDEAAAYVAQLEADRQRRR